MEQRQISDKGLGFITSFLEFALQSVVFLSLMCAAYGALVPKEELKLYKCFIVIIPILVGYLSRKFVNRFSIFMVIHIAMIALGVFIGGSEAEVALNVVTMVVFTAYSVKLKNMAIDIHDSSNRVTHEMESEAERTEALRSLVAGEKVPIGFVGFMVLGYFVGVVSEKTIIMDIEVILCVIFVVLQLIYNNMLNLYQVFRVNKGKNNFPAAQMKSVNMFITVFAAVAVLLGMVIFYNGEYGNIFTLMGNGAKSLLKLIGKLVLFLLGIFGKESIDAPLIEDTTEETLEEESIAMEQPQDNGFMEALAEAFGFILIIGCIIAVIYMFKVYIKNFNISRKQGRDLIESVKPQEDVVKVEKAVSVKHRKESKEEKNVRKIYKKLVLRGNKGKAPESSHTPLRLTTDNITQDEKLASEITYIYEKARYSNEEISKEELDKMKRM